MEKRKYTQRITGDEILLSATMHPEMFAGANFRVGDINSQVISMIDLFRNDVDKYNGCVLPNRISDILRHTPVCNNTPFALIDHDHDDPNPHVYLMYDVDTPDAGLLPVMYGTMNHFPLHADDILTDNEFGFSKFGIQLVDHGHVEYLLNGLVDSYTIPNRVYRHYQRMQKSDKVIRLIEPNLPQVATLLNQPSTAPCTNVLGGAWSVAYAHTISHFEGVLPTDDAGMQGLESLFQMYLNKETLLWNIAATRQLSLYLNIELNNHSIGYVHIAQKDNAWYWVNTYRVRNPILSDSLDYNLNDAILVSIIKEAQIRGIDTLNLGVAFGYDYKAYYKPEIIWRKGLRYSEEVK